MTLGCSSILEAIGWWASTASDRIALVAGNVRIAYGELWDRIHRSAGFLAADKRVCPGDRVVLCAAPGDADYVSAYFAVHAVGAIAVPVDSSTPDWKVDFIVDHVEAKAILAPKDALGSRMGRIGFDRLLSGGHADAASRTFPKKDVIADITYTTGTTSEPKGVMLSHGNILASARNINEFIGSGATDVEILPLPLSHSFGMGRVRCALLAGGTVVLTRGLVFPGQFFGAMEAWGASGFSSVPSGIAMLLRVSGERLAQYAGQLRFVEIGSAPMPLEDKRQLMGLLPRTRLCMHYGLTEASRSAFIDFHASPEKLDSVGTPTPGVEIRICEPSGTELGLREVGEIQVRAATVMRGYWRDDEQTRSALDHGWLRTGDLAWRDEEGFLYLVGREREIINVGGRKVLPAEVEREIAAYPGIEKCACVGVPDPRGVSGEVVKACLVASPGESPDEEALIAFLRDRLEPFKVPMVVEWLADLPYTESGKLRRLALRDTHGGRFAS